MWLDGLPSTAHPECASFVALVSPGFCAFWGRAVSTSMSSLPLGTGTDVVVILAIGWVTFCFKAVNVWCYLCLGTVSLLSAVKTCEE